MPVISNIGGGVGGADAGTNGNAGATMELVPVELQRRILYSLDTGSMLNAALCCRRWLHMLTPLLPELKHLNITLESASCDAPIRYRNEHDTSATVCQCQRHVQAETELIRELLAQLGGRLRSIQIEDNMLNRCSEECIRDYPFHVILGECNADNLQQLSLHCVDLSSVRVWTLSTLARYSALRSISFEECKFPAELNESLFLRMLAPSFAAIQVLRITNNLLVTDKLGIQVAKRCVCLTELSLRGCPNITAVTVVAFCEHLAAADPIADEQREQRPIPITIDLRGTAFDSMELGRHLNNPLFRGGTSNWLVQPISVNIGFDRNALLLAERNRLGALAITLFVD